MKRQRGAVDFGMASSLFGTLAKNPVVLIFALVALLSAAGALVYQFRAFVSGIEADGYDRGKQTVRAEYETRDAEQMRAAQAEIQRLGELVRAKEQKGVEAIAAAQNNHATERRHVEAERDRAIAAVRRGERLRDPGARPAACPAGGELPMPAASAAATGGEQPAGALISEAASGFLFEFAADADALRADLALAWDIARQDRMICNGRP